RRTCAEAVKIQPGSAGHSALDADSRALLDLILFWHGESDQDHRLVDGSCAEIHRRRFRQSRIGWGHHFDLPHLPNLESTNAHIITHAQAAQIILKRKSRMALVHGIENAIQALNADDHGYGQTDSENDEDAGPKCVAFFVHVTALDVSIVVSS